MFLFSDLAISPDLSTVSILTIGFVLGLRHATEADHLAAVSTIVSERKSFWSSSLVGGLWGVGHTISLFVVGLLVIFLKLQISERTENWLEFTVGAMLVLLGLNALRKLLSGEKSIHAHTHDHGVSGHAHVHIHDKSAEVGKKMHHGLSPRSLVIGMIHGLAGSAALMLLVLPAIDSPFTAMLYILIFGIGSIGGMMIMSFLLGLPLYFTANNFKQINVGIRGLAGIFSLALGLFIMYERGFGS